MVSSSRSDDSGFGESKTHVASEPHVRFPV